MNRKRLLTLAGGLVVLVLGTGCPGEDQDLRKYLGTSGRMYKWEEKVQDAICQLEVNNPGGLVSSKRICPSGPPGITPPPAYPPS